MGAEDMKAAVLVRSVLARHWIDNTLVSIMVHRGAAHISGRLHKITAIDDKDDMNEDELMVIEMEIKRIKGVKRVIYNLEGWYKDGGRFVKSQPSYRPGKEEKKREKPSVKDSPDRDEEP